MYNIYGKSGSEGDALIMTETICEGGRREVDLGKGGPTIFLGDFNATPNKLITIKAPIEREWADAGSKASWWGKEPNQPTCRANSKATQSRIDGGHRGCGDFGVRLQLRGGEPVRRQHPGRLRLLPARVQRIFIFLSELLIKFGHIFLHVTKPILIFLLLV